MRLSLETIKLHLQNEVSVAGQTIHFGTAYDIEYMREYDRKQPAIWVAGQTTRGISTQRNESFTGLHAQKLSAEVAIRVVLKRSVTGDANTEDLMQDFFDEIYNAMFGWKERADYGNFYFTRTQDGASNEESLLVGDMYFACTVNLRRTP